MTPSQLLRHKEAAKRKPRTYTSPNVARYAQEPPLRPASTVDEAISRTHEFLQQTQHEEGYWWGELESNNSMESEYVMLLYIMDEWDAERVEKIANLLQKNQLPTGGWSMYYGGGADLSTSIECYMALKMAGISAESEPMRRARKLILKKGGIENARVFTKIWLAMLGQWEWKGVPYLMPELILIPNKLPLNIYSFASWARATVIPMTVILSQRPVWHLREDQSVDELYLNGKASADYSLKNPSGGGWERLLFTADEILRRAERLLTYNPARSIALSMVEKWILKHQEADGSWGGIQPPWVYSLIALRLTGHGEDDPVIRRSMDGFNGFGIDDGDTWRLQACVSPVWDTCLTLNALAESRADLHESHIMKATDWLVGKQIKSRGDWSLKAPSLAPGGWAFEFENEMYPDIDDAAEILFALARCPSSNPEEKEKVIELGIRWILGLQSRNGGWGSFDKDNTSKIAARLPFFDFGEAIDPPSVDVTAHVIEAISVFKKHFKEAKPKIEKALDYIWKEQEADGPWFGRWGINYIYGTAAVLPALAAVDPDMMSDPRIVKAADWIESVQNPDGGWGETPASYANPALRGSGESCASQTAWALLALIAAGRTLSKAAKFGIEYLISKQAQDGTWSELHYSATGFPGYGVGERIFKSPSTQKGKMLPHELPSGFMIKYHMYRIYWPLLALGRWRNRVSTLGESDTSRITMLERGKGK